MAKKPNTKYVAISSSDSSSAIEEEGDHDDGNEPPSKKKNKVTPSSSQAKGQSGSGKTKGKQKAASQKTPKVSKSRQRVTLTDAQEESMIEFLKAHDELWNKKKRLYRNRVHSDALWNEQAEVVGETRCRLDIWYSSMRTQFKRAKDKKTVSGSGNGDMTEREQFIFTNFQFMGKHIGSRVDHRTVKPVSTR